MTWTEVASGIWVRSYDPFHVNVTAIDVGGGLVVVDTRGSATQGRELRTDLATLGRGEVVGVVNTHHHFDHTFGNDAFRAAPMWCHDRCADRLLGRVDGDIVDIVEEFGEEFGDGFEHDLLATDIVAPNQHFHDRTTLTVGDRAVELRWLGRAHTDNDIVVVVPDAGVIVAGDLIEESAPPAFGDSYPLAWPATLDALLELEATAYVPGHGATVDRAFVVAQRADLQVVADLARRSFHESTPIADLLADAPYPADVMEVARVRVLHELARDEWPWSRWDEPGWSVDLPEALLRQPNVGVAPDSDLLSMSLSRGWLNEDGVSIVIATAPADDDAMGRTARTAASLDRVDRHEPVRVEGGDTGAVVAGEWILDEALTPTGHERLTQVVATVGELLVSVTVRVPRAATDLAGVVERIVSSVRVAAPGR